MERIEITVLIDKYLDGTATPQQRALLEEWYASHDSKPGFIESLNEHEKLQLSQKIFSNICRLIHSIDRTAPLNETGSS